MPPLQGDRWVEVAQNALFWLVLFPSAFARHLRTRIQWNAPRDKVLRAIFGMTLIWLAGSFAWSSLIWAIVAGLGEWRGTIPDTMKQM